MPKHVAVNTKFFKTWTPEMAYALGFFTADGCLTINPRGSHYIEFTCNDRDVLEKIRTAMASKHKIGRRVRRHLNEAQTFRIQIGSKTMFDDIRKLGFTVNKTKNLTLPRVPNRYFADYVRGYFDGDGCVSYGHYRYRNRRRKKFHLLVRLVCFHKQFLVQLAVRIKRVMKTNGQTIFRQSPVYALSYSIRDSRKIIEHFYRQPSGMWMNRKYKSCQAALRMHHGDVA